MVRGILRVQFLQVRNETRLLQRIQHETRFEEHAKQLVERAVKVKLEGRLVFACDAAIWGDVEVLRDNSASGYGPSPRLGIRAYFHMSCGVGGDEGGVEHGCDEAAGVRFSARIDHRWIWEFAARPVDLHAVLFQQSRQRGGQGVQGLDVHNGHVRNDDIETIPLDDGQQIIW